MTTLEQTLARISQEFREASERMRPRIAVALEQLEQQFKPFAKAARRSPC